MRQKCNQIISIITIMLLLPCIVTIFINGPSILTGAEAGKDYLIVEGPSKTKEISVDDYAIGLMAKEMKAEFKPEALAAQAVIVRTGIYRQLTEQGKDSVFQEDAWDESTMRKSWGSSRYDTYYKKLKKAWQDTEGQVLLFNGKLITTPFHQLSNGKTRDGKEVFGTDDYAYLQSKDCLKDVEAPEELQTVLIDAGDYEILSYDSAGYVLQIRQGETTYTGEEFRQEHDLPSACFTLQEYEGKIRVTTKGVGHGIGLSQYAANEMAKEGSSYQDILLYFYTGVEIKEVAEIL